MGIFSSSVSLIRYTVNGNIENPVIDTVKNGLQKYAINDFEEETSEKNVGWTCFDKPFEPSFKGSQFVIGPHFVFSLRIDKKNISSKIIQKHYSQEYAKQLNDTGRTYLSKNEKKALKDHVINVLSLRIPPTPNVYDIIWNYEESTLYFLSTLKSANEELETLFFKTFKISLIRLFPYTMADLTMGLSDNERDVLLKLAPTKFMIS